MILLFLLLSEPIELESNLGHFTFIVKFEQVKVNQAFQIQIKLNNPPEHPFELRFDAAMPDHRHGLALPFKLTKLDRNNWLIEDLVLHMPGYWELYFDLYQGESIERTQFSLELKL